MKIKTKLKKQIELKSYYSCKERLKLCNYFNRSHLTVHDEWILKIIPTNRTSYRIKIKYHTTNLEMPFTIALAKYQSNKKDETNSIDIHL